MELEVNDDERGVLLYELDGFLEMTAALHGQVGRRWDSEDVSGLAPDVALVVRVRDQLRGDGPWRVEGTAEELKLLLGRLRAAAELALQRGAQPSPARRSAPATMSDAEGTDMQLDIMRVTGALLQRL